MMKTREQDALGRNGTGQSDSVIQMVVGGDISLDTEVRTPVGVFRLKGEGDGVSKYQPWGSLSIQGKIGRKLANKIVKIWNAVKISSGGDGPFDEQLIKTVANEKRAEADPYFQSALIFKIAYPNKVLKYSYPFAKIKAFLKSKDLVLANLETPLALGCKCIGFFMSDPQYAEAMADAGISVVSLANNHSFDAGEMGLLQTIDYLNKAGISYTGAGDNLDHARLGASVELKGKKITFLGYTQYCNRGFASVANEYPGILPLDQELIREDIRRAKKSSDFVFPVLHWGLENRPNIHPRAIEIAHSLVDAGADGIIGHHPHIPQGIEVYEKKPIIYSLGNFIFGHNREEFWSDNYLAELIIEDRHVKKVKLYPISGRGEELFQPELIGGHRATSVLECLQHRSSIFGTKIDIRDNVGFISIQ